MQRSDLQFQRPSTIVQHAGSYTGIMGEISYDTVNQRLVLHDGCTCGGVAYAEMTPTECAPVKGE